MNPSLPKIDVHVHCGPYNVTLIRNTSFPELTRDIMPPAGIEIACISHTESVFHEMTGGNAKLAAELPKYPQLRGYIYVDPLRVLESLAEIDKYADHPQFVGIKSRSEYHGMPFDGPEYGAILKHASGRGWVMLHHTFSVDVARRMKNVMPDHDLNFIIAHSGGGAWRETARLMAGMPNAYMDLCSSIVDRDKARYVADTVGLDHLVFGTDMNLISPFWVIGMFEEAGFSEAELRQVYWENAARLLHIS